MSSAQESIGSSSSGARFGSFLAKRVYPAIKQHGTSSKPYKGFCPPRRALNRQPARACDPFSQLLGVLKVLQALFSSACPELPYMAMIVHGFGEPATKGDTGNVDAPSFEMKGCAVLDFF